MENEALKKLVSELEGVNDEHNQEIESLKGEICSITEDNKAVAAEITDLRKKLEVSKFDLRNMRTQANNAEMTVTKLKEANRQFIWHLKATDGSRG